MELIERPLYIAVLKVLYVPADDILIKLGCT